MDGEYVDEIKEAREIQRVYHEEHNKYPSIEEFISISEGRVGKEVINYINEERNLIQSSKDRQWVVDDSTGIILFPVNDETTFHSIHITHDGRKVQGEKVVHPGISSSIALNKQQLHINKKYGKEYDEKLLISRIEELLLKNGIEKCEDGIKTEIEVWKERLEARHQNRSKKFSIIETISNSVLAKLKKTGKNKITVISVYEKNSESIRRIYVEILTEEVFLLHSDTV